LVVRAFLLPLLAAASAPADRPINIVGHPWAPFISPMGEPFRARGGTEDALARWFNQADSNHDGQISLAEMQADAERFFAVLDSDGDGQIGPDELIQYEWEIAPDIQVNSRLKRQPGEAAPAKPPEDGELDPDAHRSRRGRGEPDWLSGSLQGAARYGLLNMPEPVAAADADFNRAISRAEFRQAALDRFQLLDRDHRGALTLDRLEAMWGDVLATLHLRKSRKEPTDSRVGAPLPPDR
jgi:Ca2+-binding EF-hand superfamily protein